MTYLRKRSSLRDNNTVKEKLKSVNSQNGSEKHRNNIDLDKKSQNEVIKENESNLKESDSIDNGEILKKLQNQSSEERNEQNLTEIKTVENVDQNVQNLIKKPEDNSTRSTDTIEAEESNIQEAPFTNSIDNLNQCTIILEDKQIDKDNDRVVPDDKDSIKSQVQ